MKIIMLGAPGAGKGTQASRMAECYKIPHISTGDIFRQNIKDETTLGKLAKTYIDKGALVPDELVINLVIDRLTHEDCNNGFILDGFPRTIAQAESLKKSLAEKNMNIDYAIDIDVADDVIVKRISGRRSCPKCGAVYHIQFNQPTNEGICNNDNHELIQRNDDKPETVMHRLNVYHEQTQPLIEYYRKENILHSIDGTMKTDEVFDEITKILGK